MFGFAQLVRHRIPHADGMAHFKVSLRGAVSAARQKIIQRGKVFCDTAGEGGDHVTHCHSLPPRAFLPRHICPDKFGNLARRGRPEFRLSAPGGQPVVEEIGPVEPGFFVWPFAFPGAGLFGSAAANSIRAAMPQAFMP